MSEEQKDLENYEDSKYFEVVDEIQNNALYNELPNGMVVELAYQQALSIHLRSRQLIREGKLHPNQISQKAKAAQIEKCYKQRFRGQRNSDEELV